MKNKYPSTFSLLILIALISLFTTETKAQTNIVPDSIELKVLKNIYDSLGVSGWTNKANWPSPGNWPATATSAQFGTWAGVIVSSGDIRTLNMINNNLTGLLPKSLSRLTRLNNIYISNNHISGTIPASIGSMNSVINFYATDNDITGSIPSQLGNMANLEKLYLNGNELSGSIPSSLCDLTDLTDLRLNGNNLTGSIPSDIGDLETLTILFLESNELSGNIPSSIVNLENLRQLNLSSNQLDGTIPENIGDLTELVNLYLNSNQFTGTLPASIGDLMDLEIFNASINQLTGSIPASFSSLSNLWYFSVRQNLLSGEFPSLANWTDIAQLYIYNNQFSGPFPAGLQNCIALTTVNAQQNKFTSLPATILGLPALVTLNFENNEINTIPDFSTHVNKSNLSLYLRDNRLDFGQIETFVGEGLDLTTYSQQKSFNDIVYIKASPGQDMIITPRDAGVNGIYTWYFQADGTTGFAVVNSQNVDATQKTFKRTAVQQGAVGLYKYRMTNSTLSGIIESVPITVRVGSDVIWNEMEGVVLNNELIAKTAVDGWNNAKMISENALPANTDGWFEFVIDRNVATYNYAIGFSQTSDNTRASLVYGVGISNSGGQKLFIHESSENGTELGTWALGDVIRISRTGSMVRYYKNGYQIGSVSVNANNGYKAKTVMQNGNAPLFTSSFGLDPSRGVVPDAWEYEALRDLYQNLGGNAWTTKTSWPASFNGTISITAAQMDTWHGIAIENGDITSVSLLSNNLTGSIPASISKLKSLKTIDFRINQISGTLPAALTSLINLENLRVHDNLLSGPIPADIGNLVNLKELMLAKNNFSGSVPESIGDLTQLSKLSLYLLSGLTGPLPQSFYNLVNLTELLMYDTQINGSLLPEIGNFTQLIHFYGYRNNWSGTLPSTLGNLPALKNLYLFSNHFTGEIPENFRNLPAVENLWLHFNQLSGDVPGWLGELEDLTILSIGDNDLTGTIPASLGNLTNLTGLYLQKLNLTGPIPDELENLNHLTILDLKFSGLEGSVPDWLVQKTTLKEFILNDNKFTGLPDFSSRADKASIKLNVENNLIPLADIADNFHAAGAHGFQAFTYGPQQPSLEQPVIHTPIGGELRIEAPAGDINSAYLWEKLTGETWVNVNNLNQSSIPNEFIIDPATSEDAGTYRYTVTNTWVPGVAERGEIDFILIDEIKVALDLWAFQYKYDGRRRMTHKKIPGADWVYMVYDNRDRLVMTQDGNQRASNPKEWTFTKYDALNRPALTGIYKDTDSEGLDQAEMQGEVNDFYEALGTPGNTDAWFEKAGTVVHGYTNQSFPKVSNESDYLTVTYYDGYAFRDNIPGGGFNYDDAQLPTADGTYEAQEPEEFDHVTGQVTGTRVKNLETNDWYYTVNYYDDQYRAIQSIMRNQKGGIDKVTSVYDFPGRVTRTKTSHSLGTGPAYAITRKFVYDHGGRLLETHHKTNTTDYVLLAENKYNELGQLVTKKLHSENNGTSFRQHEDYRYNIRGWLTRINNSNLSDVDEGPKDLFGMEFGYNNNLNIGTFTPQYNGNISATKWSTNLGLGFNDEGLEIFEPVERGYRFTYDPLNRFLAANHTEKTFAWNASGSFHENNLSYDLNGNIDSLDRKGVNGSDMDLLAYIYSGNQLQKVVDNGDDEKGFKDGTNSDNDYAYDGNGNMVLDKNKDIAAIRYNHLNLPDTITKVSGEYIAYSYDATGRKLGQRVFNASDALQKETNYLGKFYYENDTLRFINHDEGRIVMTGAQPEYQYHLKDHLGNVRLTFTTKQEVDEYSAAIEDAHITDERADFPNYDDVTTSPAETYNHTDEANATRSVVLNGAQNKQIGLAKSLEVLPGDTIAIEVFAKYFVPLQTENTGTFIASAMTSAFGLSSASIGLEYSAYQSLNGMFDAGWVLGPNDWEDETAPKAFLNYILFDEDFMPYDMGWDQISVDAGVTQQNPDPDHDSLSLQAVARKPGYIYIYFSNEEQEEIVEVYFDDLNIKHRHSPVVQADNYYPFGLTFNSYQRENSVDQKFKFQGQEHIDDLNLGWDSFKWRNYMPDIGRFFNVDPLAAKYVYNSPYAFSENHVTSHVELEGLEKVSIHSASFAPYNTFGGTFLGDGANRKFGTNPQASSRISGSVNLNLSGSGITKTGSSKEGSVSVNLANGGVSKSEANLTSTIDGQHSNGTSAMADVGFHLSGNNSQVPGSSDIDVKGQMQVGVVDMGENGSMATFSGAVTGDKFPANETYITDQSGAGVFLGVSGADAGGGNEHTGPFTQLPFDNNRTMSQFTIGVKFDSKGNIQSVQVGGKTYNPQDWNKQFQNQNAQSGSTSTNSH